MFSTDISRTDFLSQTSSQIEVIYSSGLNFFELESLAFTITRKKAPKT